MSKYSRHVEDLEEDCDLCGKENDGANLRRVPGQTQTERSFHILCLPCAWRAWQTIADLARRVHAQGGLHS